MAIVKHNASGSSSLQEAKNRAKQEVERLERDVRQLKIDQQRFLARDLDIPPEEESLRIGRELRRLQNLQTLGSAERFRLTTLEAQYNSNKQLFDRRLREFELGGRRKPVRVEPQHDPYTGVVVGAKGSPGAVEALYQGMYMRDGKSSPKMDLERFRSHLERQVETIRAKTGARDIQFRIAQEDGKLKIKAKPIKS